MSIHSLILEWCSRNSIIWMYKILTLLMIWFNLFVLYGSHKDWQCTEPDCVLDCSVPWWNWKNKKLNAFLGTKSRRVRFSCKFSMESLCNLEAQTHWKNKYLNSTVVSQRKDTFKELEEFAVAASEKFLDLFIVRNNPRPRTHVESQGRVRASSDWALKTLQPPGPGATSARPWLGKGFFFFAHK